MDLSLNQGMSLPLYFLLTVFFFLFIAASKTRRSSSHGNKLPPGPPALPLVGNIFQLGPNRHRSLADFSKTYGPVMSLKLGRVTAVVISSPEAAKEALRTHDSVISSRSFNDPVRAVDHHKHSVVWNPPSPRWRFLKKTLSKYLLSNLDAIESLRMRKVEELVSLANQFSKRGEAIDLARASFVTAFNIISNALFSVDLATYDSNSSPCEFYHAVVQLMKVSGKPNVGDYFGYLRFLDLHGTRKEAVDCTERLFSVIQEFIDARLAKRLSHTDTEPEEASSTDMLDSLLDLTQQNEAELTINDIKHLLLDMFVAGTDTSSSTMEWAMSELVRSPEKMVKAQSEIQQVIGDNGVVKESDIPSLPYLQAIVKETLRLHPPLPVIPRKSESDVHIMGFLIPENTQDMTRVCGKIQ
ncbi:PREDICTED: cytochrome P450 76C3-like isoform X1 [Camelina sativa]|uniref:Cytochrome P450 76C3-like isoform X1 n=1 Tax=Camelina sativa TaxID=90675 RepID=A0ABM0YZ24_CAMSA|nr:PREDICTED: cytochrome P450 76C3-like isoform X1 [Camelina sativa]